MENHQNFKVGDRVVVGSISDIMQCQHGYNANMDSFADREATVTGVNWYGYSIDIDNGCYAWCDKSLLHPDMNNPDFKCKTSDLFALLNCSS